MAFILVLGALAAVVFHVVVTKTRRLGDQGTGAWSDAAARVNLTVSNHFHLHELIRRHRVLVDVRRQEQGGRQVFSTVLRMNAPPAAANLTLRSESRWSRVQKLLGAQDVLLHDDDFDEAVHVQGDPATVVGLLDEKLRETLLAFVERGGEVDAGELCVELPGVVNEAKTLLRATEELVALRKAMDVDPAGTDERLAHNAQHEREASLRLRNLDLLIQRAPRGQLARATASALLRDRDARVRLKAARLLLDDDSFQTLGAIVKSRKHQALREEALALLLEFWSYAQCRPWIEVALRSDRPRLSVLALEAAVAAGDRTQLELIARGTAEGDEKVIAAAAQALGMLGDASHEQVLLPLLSRDNNDVKLAATRALGRIGTIASVEPLLPLTSGLLVPGVVKEAARDSIRAIQARVGPVEGGRLSLVDEHESAGRLSLSREGGELSEADEPSPKDRARLRG